MFATPLLPLQLSLFRPDARRAATVISNGRISSPTAKAGARRGSKHKAMVEMDDTLLVEISKEGADTKLP